MATSVYELYGELWGKGAPGFSEELERSLNPRSADDLYDAFAACGVTPDQWVLDIGSRDAGHALETSDDWGDWGEALLKLARMRRREAKLVRRFGRSHYEAAYAGNLWGIYQFLGKLCPTVYRLQKP